VLGSDYNGGGSRIISTGIPSGARIMGIYDKRVCHCGSGKSSLWQLDGNGIPLCRTCAECHERKMSGYRVEVLVPYGQDVVDEPIEPDDY
jgi:hypothetical protein